MTTAASHIEPDARVAVRCQDLKRHFLLAGRSVRAVDGVSMQVERGELLGVVGTSGSGKTTLLNLIGGLDTPTDGSLEVFGTHLETLDERARALYRRDRVGIIFQTFHLLAARSALENVELPLMLRNVPPGERREAARSALGHVGLEERSDHRPDELSGGEQQRVAIARALVKRPDLLLADEPTGNLDSTTSREILDLIRNLSRDHGLTVLLVSHDEGAVDRIAGRSIRLRDGQVVGEGAT